MSDFSTARRNMVDGQIRPSSVTDWRIIDAMRAVPRDAFVPANQRELAYLDLDLDVSGPGAVERWLLRPVVTARLLQAANLQLSEHVLVVGCATGYFPALAAKLAGRVTATESEGPLAAQARDVLQRLGGFGNVEVHTAAAVEGVPASGPYDAIILNGATEIVPTPLYRQLRDGGRLVGIFSLGRTPRAELVTRSGDDFGQRKLFDVSAPALPGLQRPAGFVF
jgi:protein-L-isoaspartate(D-aspartate) O-methyltransferase